MMGSWKKSTLLGEGTYGKVFLASPANENDDTLIAVKSADVKDSMSYDSLKDEESFLKKLNGEPHIVRCFGKDESVENGARTYNLLLEYATEGTLYDLIHSSPRPEPDANRVAYCTKMLLTALSRIHAHGIVHCDLKPDNILVFHPDELKIADFGRAEWVLWPEEACVWDEKYWNRGATLYAAPESVARGDHGTSADIWSLGIIVAEMMNPGPYFFDDEKDLYDQIVHQPLELDRRVPDNFDEYAVDFLEKCLDRNPTKRWSAQELLKHPFVTENLPFVGSDDHQIKAENPIEGFCDWVSASDLFTTDEEDLEPLYDYITDLFAKDDELHPPMDFLDEIQCH